MKKYAVTFPILYGGGIERQYGVNGLPSLAVIGRDGNVRYRATGFYGDKTLRALEVVVNEVLKN